MLLSSEHSSLYIALQTSKGIFAKTPMAWFSFSLHMDIENESCKVILVYVFAVILLVFRKKNLKFD